MSESPERTYLREQRAIARTRAADALSKLVAIGRDKLDPSPWVRKRPWLAVATVAFGGFLIGRRPKHPKCECDGGTPREAPAKRGGGIGGLLLGTLTLATRVGLFLANRADAAEASRPATPDARVPPVPPANSPTPP